MTVFDFSIRMLNSAAFLYLFAAFLFILSVAASGKKSGVVVKLSVFVVSVAILSHFLGAFSRTVSVYAFLSAFLIFLVSLFVKARGQEGFWGRAAVLVSTLAFLAHTGGLLLRWYEGGLDRPPWTNLYESLIFFAWGGSVFQMLSNYKWKMPIVGLALMPLVFLLMGMSVMTPNKLVEPLIPALQSNWLKIHVVFGMISYGAFTGAACFSFLHLMKNKVSMSKIGAMMALLMLLNLSIAGTGEIFRSGKFYMARSVERELSDGSKAHVKDTYRDYEGGPVMTRMEEVPYANFPFWLSFVSFLLAALLMFRRRTFLSPNDLSRESKWAYGVGLLSMMTLLGLCVLAKKTNPNLDMASNPYLMMLLVMSLFFGVSYLIIHWRYDAFMEKLPSAEKMHELDYKNVMAGFSFQTLLLITGAIWAYYAWGRSWGWDPKETWALITWFVYLIYLHGKLLLNWKSNFLSILSILGFFVLVFAFLGVNLVLSGLHSYGSG